MSSEDKPKKFKFPWWVVAPIIAIASLSFAGYRHWFYDDNPKLEIQILSKTKILDIKEPVARLDVLLDSVSLIETNQELEVVVARLANVGESEVAINDYDPSDPIGFTVLNGNTIEAPKILEASNPYLMSPDRIRSGEDHGVFLEPSILNKGDFMIVKILVLSSADKQTEIVAKGIIAGGGVPNLTYNGQDDDSSKAITELEKFFILLFTFLLAAFMSSIIFWVKGLLNAKKELKYVSARNKKLVELLLGDKTSLDDLKKEINNTSTDDDGYLDFEEEINKISGQ